MSPNHVCLWKKDFGARSFFRLRRLAHVAESNSFVSVTIHNQRHVIESTCLESIMRQLDQKTSVNDRAVIEDTVCCTCLTVTRGVRLLMYGLQLSSRKTSKAVDIVATCEV